MHKVGRSNRGFLAGRTADGLRLAVSFPVRTKSAHRGPFITLALVRAGEGPTLVVNYSLTIACDRSASSEIEVAATYCESSSQFSVSSTVRMS